MVVDFALVMLVPLLVPLRALRPMVHTPFSVIWLQNILVSSTSLTTTLRADEELSELIGVRDIISLSASHPPTASATTSGVSRRSCQSPERATPRGLGTHSVADEPVNTGDFTHLVVRWKEHALVE